MAASEMLSKEQLLHLFDRFAFLTSQPEVVSSSLPKRARWEVLGVKDSDGIFGNDLYVKKRIADAVSDKQEAVAVTTAIQEEIFSEMGIDPRFGLACLGKINMTYETDRDLMIRFYEFVAKEEMACEEAELGPDRFAERLKMQQNLQEQQLEMLKYMRNFHMDDQSAILEKIHQQLEKANFDAEASVLTVEQMQDVVRRRVSPLFQPR